MKKVIYILTVTFSTLTIATYIAFKLSRADAFEILYITFMTFSYHFIMRLIVGAVMFPLFKKKYDYNGKWFIQKPFEKKLYKFLKVKKWKEKVPSWSPGAFVLENNTLHNIAIGMCNAEAVHEVIVALSFVPILFSIKYGVPAVFIITSILASSVDMIFVIVQRYNRPRIVKLINKNKGE